MPPPDAESRPAEEQSDFQDPPARARSEDHDTPPPGASATTFAVGDRVRCQRQETARGSWNRYAGRVVLAHRAAGTNADLIADCAALGYLTLDGRTLDPTYGRGRFWTKWRPDHLVACDIDPALSPIGRSVDFTHLPFADGTFRAVTFDPPYKLNGTGGSHPSDAAYGVATRGISWQERHRLIAAGIDECVRVLEPNGVLLIKCQDQVCSGWVRWQHRDFAEHAEQAGCKWIDMLQLAGHHPQPPGRRQVHARRNYSTLLVLRKAVTP